MKKSPSNGHPRRAIIGIGRDRSAMVERDIRLIGIMVVSDMWRRLW